MLRFGPFIILRVDEEPFYCHFKKFWAKMPPDMKEAARMAAVHLKYRPGMKPQPETVTMNIDGAEV